MENTRGVKVEMDFAGISFAFKPRGFFCSK
jgi:hypothetical protein